MSEKTEQEPTLDKLAIVEKTEHLEVTLTPKRSKRPTRANLLDTWSGTKPLLLATIDKAAENGVQMVRQNIVLDGREVACLVMPTQRWIQTGKYVDLEDVK